MVLFKVAVLSRFSPHPPLSIYYVFFFIPSMLLSSFHLSAPDSDLYVVLMCLSVASVCVCVEHAVVMW